MFSFITFARREETTQLPEVEKGFVYDYIFFYGEDDLAKRIQEYKTQYPKMQLLKKCEPSPIDRLLRYLNPRNANEYIEVWETHDRW